MHEPILVVDDSDTNRRLFEDRLRYAGYDVTAVSDGFAGLKAAAATAPAAILLDMRMPGLSGIEVCRHLRRHRETQKTPVLIYTAEESDDARKMDALLAGADAYYHKPVDFGHLLQQLRRITSRKLACCGVPEQLVISIVNLLTEKVASTIENSTHAFASFSSRDQMAVLERINRLERLSVPCWYFRRNIGPGAHPGEQMRRAIRRSFAFLLFISKHTLSSAAVDGEIEWATDCGRSIIPIRIDQTPISELISMNRNLENAQFMDWMSTEQCH